jgi:hypothetical protein
MFEEVASAGSGFVASPVCDGCVVAGVCDGDAAEFRDVEGDTFQSSGGIEAMH